MPAALRDRRTRARAGAALMLGLGAGMGIIGLSGCGSSDAASVPSQPATTVVVTTTAVGSQITVTEADVVDLEKQLDEIDQLLNGVDADLAQD